MSKKNIFSHKPVILDGALGTLLKSYGIEYKDIPFCSIENPELLVKAHSEYVKAGSEIITTNSFRLNPMTIKGKNYSLEELIITSVNIARQCAGESLIAYDIGPLGINIGSKVEEQEMVFKAYKAIAEIIEKLPIDIIFIETMYQLQEAKMAIKALKSCNKDIFCSFTFNEKGRLYSGESVEEVIKEIEPLKVEAIGTNCIPSDKSIEIAKRFLENTPLPIIVKPNLGIPEERENKLYYGITEEQYLEHMIKLAKEGVTYLGGCCGTTPRHLEALSTNIL